jgi:Dihaem cytochrome c
MRQILFRFPRSLSLFTLLLLAATSAHGDDDDGPRREERAGRHSATPVDPLYKSECSSCHMLYPPWLLPARSWKAILGGLAHHFGENAESDLKTVEHLSKVLQESSSDHSSQRLAQKIDRSIPSNTTPLKFSETTFFKRLHREVGAKVWQRKSIGTPGNCSACHAKAESGDFDEDGVRIPK